MGFSQGGLFLRYYAQYCNSPPIKNLITFGTPHYGIAALIPCPTPPTLSCLLAARAARSGIYSTWAQTHLVQAAYYRDPARMDEFVETNTFIRDLNGEGRWLAGEKGEKVAGGKGLGGLDNLVAVMFDADSEYNRQHVVLTERDGISSSIRPFLDLFFGQQNIARAAGRTIAVRSRLDRSEGTGRARRFETRALSRGTYGSRDGRLCEEDCREMDRKVIMWIYTSSSLKLYSGDAVYAACLVSPMHGALLFHRER